MAAYLGLGPERVTLRLDWSDVLEARLVAHRNATLPVAADLGSEGPSGEAPDHLRRMIQDRADAHQAAVEAAEEAAIVVLPPSTRRDVLARAASIDATIEFPGGGGEVRLVVPLPADADNRNDGDDG